MYPDEVFGNIFASYNVPLFVALAMIMAGLLLDHRAVCSCSSNRWRWRDRIGGTGATVVLGMALWLAWSIAPTVAADTRVANEVALNGWATHSRLSHIAPRLRGLLRDGACCRGRHSRRALINQSNRADGLIRHFTPRSRNRWRAAGRRHHHGGEPRQ